MDGPSLVYPTDPYLTDYSRPSPVVEAALRDNHLRLNNSPNLCRTERDLQAAENPYQNFAHRCLQWNHSKSWTISFKKCPSFFAFFCPWRSHLQNETWHCPRCWKRLCKVHQIFWMVLYLPFNRFEPVWSWTDFQRSSPAPEPMHRPMYSRSTPLSSFTTEPRPYQPRSLRETFSSVLIAK